MEAIRQHVDQEPPDELVRKVIEAIEDALALRAGVLDRGRAVLAQFDNMSAPTALFLLNGLLWPGFLQPQ